MSAHAGTPPHTPANDANDAAEAATAAALSRALETRGLRCAVEARGSLAVLTPIAGTERLADDAERAALVALAREHGFTHVALELLDPSPLTQDGATLRRD